MNYGVQAYLNRNTTRAFFERFGVNLINPDLGDVSDFATSKTISSEIAKISQVLDCGLLKILDLNQMLTQYFQYIDLLLLTDNVDFSTGESVDVDYGPLDVAGIPIALLRYLDIVSDYQPWFENGYFQTGEMPDDLTLPFGEFLDKYDLGASLGVLRNLLWLSDALNTPTFHVLAVVGAPQIQAFGLGLAGPSFKWPETYSSETLFDNVLSHLGPDVVLLESTIASSQRTDTGVTVTIQTPTGPKTVNAKKLLISATPSPDNVGSWDLDDTEKSLFGKFSWETLYVG